MAMTKTHDSIKYHRDALRALSREHIKMAEIGGDQDMPFEQAFSNLAHAYLKDKAPSLLDYEVGFQLVDRNQENTKAIGVFGFKVGSQWLYAPIFFLNGDLKGHELLYIKNQDMFVPMKENWLNYILNKKPSILGESVTRNSAQLGVLPPNLYQLSRSPYKYASAWVQDALPTFAYMVTTSPKNDPKYKDLVDLPTFLNKEGRAAINPLLIACRAYPKFAAAIERIHGMDIIKNAISEMKVKEAEESSNSVLSAGCKMTPDGLRCVKKRDKSVIPPGASTDPIKSGALKIAVKNDVMQPSGNEFTSMSDKDRSILMREGVLIKDKRLNVSKAYDVQAQLKLTNPPETGIYEVLTKAGTYEKCLIILGPHAASSRKMFCTVVRLDGERNWLNIHPSYIWTKNQLSPEAFRKWLDDQKDATLVADDGTQVIVAWNGQGSLPFTVDKDLGDANGIKTYDVYFEQRCEKERPDHLKERPQYAYDSEWSSDGQRIIITSKDGRMHTSRGGLYIPLGCKVIKVKEPWTPKYDKKKDRMGYPSCGGQSEVPPIIPGDLADIQLLIMQKTAAIKLYHNGSEININGSAMTPLQGLIHLVAHHGLREKQARAMLKEAAAKKMTRYRIKYADEYHEMQRSGPTAPTMPDMPTGYDPLTGGNVPTQSMLEANVPVPGMSAASTDRNIYNPTTPPQPSYQSGNTGGRPDQKTMQTVMNAAATGQKEVFDTSIIASLLRSGRSADSIQRYMPSLLKANDAIGRIYMIMLWNNEAISEHYGKSEMLELEESLRTCFENNGDLILSLKQNSVDPYPEELEDLGGNLDDISE